MNIYSRKFGLVWYTLGIVILLAAIITSCQAVALFTKSCV